MKITDIVYKKVSEVDAMPRFDLQSMPRVGKWYLQPVAWLLSLPDLLKYGAKIHKHGMKGLKGGYLLLCNHNSFFDFKMATKAFFPRRANYIVAVDGFINREQLMRNVGCFGKRKFISDPGIVKQIKTSIVTNKQICALYPEARYALVGTTAILPDSLGKLVKLLGSPVVTLIGHGHHLLQPVWNLKMRKIKTTADMTYLLTPEQIKTMSVDEINKRIREAFVYDDYRYQLENKIVINTPDRAEGLHKPLYQCPACRAEKMNSKGTQLFCLSCGKRWEMNEYGQLHALAGETEFSHIPDWFEWIRQQVRQEIESGRYRIACDVQVDSLPNSTGFYRFGVGHLVHDMDGFHLHGEWHGETLHIDKLAQENYSVHIEYDYCGTKGDAVIFSLPNDSYYLFPVDQSIPITKYHFAVEELYRYKTKKA